MKIALIYLINALSILGFFRYPKRLLKNELLAYWFVAGSVNQLVVIVLSINMEVIKLLDGPLHEIALFNNRIFVVPLLLVLLIDLFLRVSSIWGKIGVFVVGSGLLMLVEGMEIWGGLIEHQRLYNLWYTVLRWPLMLVFCLCFAKWYRILLAKEEGWQ